MYFPEGLEDTPLNYGHQISIVILKLSYTLPNAYNIVREAESNVGGKHGVLGESLSINSFSVKLIRIWFDEVENFSDVRNIFAVFIRAWHWSKIVNNVVISKCQNVLDVHTWLCVLFHMFVIFEFYLSQLFH